MFARIVFGLLMSFLAVAFVFEIVAAVWLFARAVARDIRRD